MLCLASFYLTYYGECSKVLLLSFGGKKDLGKDVYIGVSGGTYVNLKMNEGWSLEVWLCNTPNTYPSSKQGYRVLPVHTEHLQINRNITIHFLKSYI